MVNELDRDNQQAFARLLECLVTDQPLALVGSGLAMRANFPSWDGLIEDLHQLSGIAQRLGMERARLISSHPDKLYRADLYRRELQRNDPKETRYFRFLKCTFQSAKRPVDPTIRKFVRLGFAHFLTTNYDESLQEAFRRRDGDHAVVEWRNNADERDAFITSLGTGRPRLPHFVHLHGIWTHPKTIVLTENDYLERYVKQEEARRLLFAIFATKRVVFVGFGLQDPDLMQLLRTVASSLTGRSGRHFALLSHDPSKDDAQFLREMLVQKFDIDPVFYPYTPLHGRLVNLVDALESRKLANVPSFTAMVPSAWGGQQSSRKTRGVKRSGAAARQAHRIAFEWANEHPVSDPDDPQKGRWGGKPVANGRRLKASVQAPGDGWYEITLEVETLKGTPPLAGPVWFHLHPTFPEPVLQADTQTGRHAQLDLAAYGAFTVGAEVGHEIIDRKPTRLELDLSKLRGAPKAFREA
jgi:hypothetical protein